MRPIKSAPELVHPEVWETDEELDAFLADLDARRRAGRSPQARPVDRRQRHTWIAASRIARGLPLATRNVKHFEDFATYYGRGPRGAPAFLRVSA